LREPRGQDTRFTQHADDRRSADVHEIGREFDYHGVINHAKKEYVVNTNSTNAAEGIFSLLSGESPACVTTSGASTSVATNNRDKYALHEISDMFRAEAGHGLFWQGEAGVGPFPFPPHFARLWGDARDNFRDDYTHCQSPQAEDPRSGQPLGWASSLRSTHSRRYRLQPRSESASTDTVTALSAVTGFAAHASLAA
jgi:hypothetical protein